jgi:hypothetical protein
MCHNLHGALPKSLPMENCFAVEPCDSVVLPGFWKQET